jgi:hypothetical protein
LPAPSSRPHQVPRAPAQQQQQQPQQQQVSPEPGCHVLTCPPPALVRTLGQDRAKAVKMSWYKWLLDNGSLGQALVKMPWGWPYLSEKTRNKIVAMFRHSRIRPELRAAIRSKASSEEEERFPEALQEAEQAGLVERLNNIIDVALDCLAKFGVFTSDQASAAAAQAPAAAAAVPPGQDAVLLGPSPEPTIALTASAHPPTNLPTGQAPAPTPEASAPSQSPSAADGMAGTPGDHALDLAHGKPAVLPGSSITPPCEPPPSHDTGQHAVAAQEPLPRLSAGTDASPQPPSQQQSLLPFGEAPNLQHLEPSPPKDQVSWHHI